MNKNSTFPIYHELLRRTHEKKKSRPQTFKWYEGIERLYRLHIKGNAGQIATSIGKGQTYKFMFGTNPELAMELKGPKTSRQILRSLDYLPHPKFYVETDEMAFIFTYQEDLTLLTVLRPFVVNAGGAGGMMDLVHIHNARRSKRGLVIKGWTNQAGKIYHVKNREIGLCIGTERGEASYTKPKQAIKVIEAHTALGTAIISMLSNIPQEGVGVVSPISPDRSVITKYRGDIEVVRRIWLNAQEYNTASNHKRSEIIARRRDHSVRGHWRKYKSGKKIWIEAHRRGDPDLGTVTSHVEYMS